MCGRGQKQSGLRGLNRSLAGGVVTSLGEISVRGISPL